MINHDPDRAEGRLPRLRIDRAQQSEVGPVISQEGVDLRMDLSLGLSVELVVDAVDRLIAQPTAVVGMAVRISARVASSAHSSRGSSRVRPTRPLPTSAARVAAWAAIVRANSSCSGLNARYVTTACSS